MHPYRGGIGRVSGRNREPRRKAQSEVFCGFQPDLPVHQPKASVSLPNKWVLCRGTTSLQMEIGLTASHTLSNGTEVPIVLWSPPVFVEAPYSEAYQKLSDDPDLEGVVRAFLSRPNDWTRITKVLELVQDRCEGHIPKTWVSSKKLERLDQTATSFPEAGGTGRHARPNYKAPSKPIAITEAEQIARKVLANWLGAS